MDRLNQGIAKLDASDDLARDGLIQRFEFTFELAWKTLQNCFEDEGLTGLNSPKTVLREAYAARLIEDEDQKSVIVRYAPQRERLDRLVEELRHAGPNRDRMRALQRFSVTLPGRVIPELVSRGDVEEIQGLHVQAVDGLYDAQRGLCTDHIRFNPDLFML